MREVTYRCRRPGCVTHQTSTRDAPLDGWLLVSWRSGDSMDAFDFCSPECVMWWAADKPRAEIIDGTL